MALTNYTDLLASVASHLHRTDLTSQIPDFVSLAENAMNYGDDELGISALRTADQETLWSGSTTGSSPYTSLPSGMLDMRELYVTINGIQTELKDGSAVPLFDSERYATVGPPQWYKMVGNVIKLVPTPDQVYSLTGWYYSAVGPLASTSTNWLMTAKPQAYLYGACTYASPWLGPQYNGQLWASGFKGAVNSVVKSDRRKRFGSIQMRTEVPATLRAGRFNINLGI